MEFPYDVVAVTGATGSFGQAITRYLVKAFPHLRLRLISRGEHRQAEMQALYASTPHLSFLIGDIRDVHRMRLAFKGADLVIHAAAIKRIDTAESNPYEAIATNVIGTWNIIQAAIDANVSQVITISSDKACKPETLYGASKQVSERLTIQANHYSGEQTRFCAARWGNVAGSQGSLIPLWRAQHAMGQPLTITSPAMSRFWLSMDEAVQFLCFIAREQSRGGLFIPHLPAFNILDLARAMLNKQADDCLVEGEDVQCIGLRGIEKISEDLATDHELSRARWHASHDESLSAYVIAPAVQHWKSFATASCKNAISSHDLEAMLPIKTCIPMEPYNSACWPYRLDVGALQKRLEVLP